ncbi:MAG TPA: phosphoribosylpyrophosphate synthetase [Bacteroidia bacterium]|nr:phosphoribosylpyrophosphate synthetase [Bacteroidia bacterium]
MKAFETLVETINYLRTIGYTEDFNLQQDCIECRQGEYKLLSHDFNIDAIYRFEGNTDPADESILYAISSEKYNLKGVLVNGYGIYSDSLTNDMAEKLKYKEPK